MYNILSHIQANISQYNLAQIEELIQNFEKDVNQCIRIDPGIQKILSDKSYFKTIPSIKEYIESTFNVRINGKKRPKRAEIEREAALIVMRNKGLSKLQDFISKLKVRPIKPKRETREVPDMISDWMKLSENELRKELENEQKYQTSKELKLAANRILKKSAGDNKLRKREKVIEIILQRMKEYRLRFEYGK